MNRVLPRMLGLAALLAPLPAAAQVLDCENATSQAEMTSCAGIDFEAADRELNAAWKDAVADARALDAELKATGGDGRPGYEESLRAAQRAWIAYRDAACVYEGFEAGGGTMEPMLGSFCLARLTRLRMKELLGEPVDTEAAEAAQ